MYDAKIKQNNGGNIKNRDKGFTLIELIVVLVIFASLDLIVTTLY